MTAASLDQSCVLSSQLVRLVAHHYHPDIQDDDIIITADVDAFIMSPDILLPLLHHKVDVWVWQYELSQAEDWTFAMSFIGKVKIFKNSISNILIQSFSQVQLRNFGKI